MDENTAIILNPAAGEGLAEERWESFENNLHKAGIHFDLYRTEYRGHGFELTQELCHNGRTRIGVFGGDGTLNEVVNGLMGSEACAPDLVAFPAGSSCDFEKKLDFTRDWIERFRSATALTVDVCRVDCHDKDGNPVHRYFINNSSVGIISLANEKFNSVSGWSKRLKQWSVDGAAIFSGLAAIREFHGFTGTVTLDEEASLPSSFSNLTFFKTSYFGGGMNYGVETDPADGELYLATVGFHSRMNLASLIPSLYIGNILKRKRTAFHKCRVARLETDSPMLIEVDGEVAGQTPATYTIIRDGIRLVV